MKGTLHSDGTRHTLRFERNLNHPIEKVWRALTDNAELAHWFPAEIRGERRAGAGLSFVFPSTPGQTPAEQASEGEAVDGRMRLYDPPKLLEYSWGDEVLRWQLQPRGPGTVLVFTHTFEDVAKSARDATGWDFCLANLENRLDGKAQDSFDSGRFEPVFAGYAEAFGPEASSKRQPGA